MEGILGQRFNITYESGAAASYLVFEGLMVEKAIDCQVEMMAANKIPFILSLSLKQVNGRLTFSFNVTSKLSLSYYLKHRKVGREEFLTIVYSITRALLECRDYFLDSRSFVLDSEYIYINPATLEISFVYLPVHIERDINNDLKSYLINLILYLADLDDSEGDNYLQKVLGCLKTEAFNIQDLNRLLRLLIGDVRQEDTGLYAAADGGKLKDTERGYISGTPGFAWAAGAAGVAGAAGAAGLYGKAQSPAKSPSSPKAWLPKVSAKGLIPALISQGTLIAAVIVSFNYIKARGNASSSGYGAVVLIAGAAEVLLLKAFFTWQVRKDNKRVKGDKGDKAGKAVKVEKAGYPDNGAFVLRTPPAEAGAALVLSGEDTEILTAGQTRYPILKSLHGGEEIHLTRRNFIIGRLSSEVDHTIANNAVGKMHAQIITEEGSCLIRDLNSRNGTYINGARIAPNMDYPLSNNDTVTLANSDYTLITGHFN